MNENIDFERKIFTNTAGEELHLILLKNINPESNLTGMIMAEFLKENIGIRLLKNVDYLAALSFDKDSKNYWIELSEYALAELIKESELGLFIIFHELGHYINEDLKQGEFCTED